MRLFVVQAFRWGDVEKHSYVAGVFSTFELAESAAKKEQDERGGKYECIVYQYELNDSEGTIISTHIIGNIKR